MTGSNLVKRLCDLLGDTPIQFGLRQQGHMPTIARMLAEGATWEAIGKAIGWTPDAAREWYEVESADIVLVLPLPPNQNREQGHWRARHRRKMAYFAACDNRARVGLIPAPPATPLARVYVAAIMRMWAPMDPDNAKYRASKWPLDYLKTRGYIVNDTAKVVTWVGEPVQIVDRTETRDTLTITLVPRTPEDDRAA